MIVGTKDDKRRVLVSLASPDFENGYAYLSVVATEQARRSGLAIEAAGLAIDYGFRAWPFRKIYAQVLETSYPQFESGIGRYWVEEGRLRSHQFYEGAFRDLITLAMYPEHRDAIVGTLLRLGAPSA
jgi:RimJ/RimL family protein N-acetyltransferase